MSSKIQISTEITKVLKHLSPEDKTIFKNICIILTAEPHNKQCLNNKNEQWEKSHTVLRGGKKAELRAVYQLKISNTNENNINTFSDIKKSFKCLSPQNPLSVRFSRSVISDSLPPHALKHAKLPCPSPIPDVCSNSCPLSRWCHPTRSSSVIPFSFHLQSFPTSGSFPVIQFITSGGQSTGVSVSASVLPINTQDWSPLGWTGWISLLSKGLSRVFSNSTVQKHQFFGTQLSL